VHSHLITTITTIISLYNTRGEVNIIFMDKNVYKKADNHVITFVELWPNVSISSFPISKQLKQFVGIVNSPRQTIGFSH
jgi:hypothetical protein